MRLSGPTGGGPLQNLIAFVLFQVFYHRSQSVDNIVGVASTHRDSSSGGSLSKGYEVVRVTRWFHC